MLKTVALADVLRAALAPVSPSIRAAFVYGSIAKGQDTAASDIDLMVIADRLTYADLFSALEEACPTGALPAGSRRRREAPTRIPGRRSGIQPAQKPSAGALHPGWTMLAGAWGRGASRRKRV